MPALNNVMLYEKVTWRLYNVRLCQKVALVYVLQEGTRLQLLQINRVVQRSIRLI